MELKRVGTQFNRVRVDLNENFDKIEGRYKGLQNRFDNAVDEVSERAFDKVVDRAKIDWLPPVDTFDDLATTYPDAEEGQTVMVRDNGKVYRMTNGVWMEIQDVDPSAINEVDRRLTSELDSLNLGIQEEFYLRGISITSFPRLEGEEDDAPRFRRAIAYIRQQVIDVGFKVITNLHVPAGEYTFRSKVVLSPYVKIKIIGFVNFITEFEGTMFHIVSNDDDPTDFSQEYLRRNSWNRGEIFDGSSGQLVFRSKMDLDSKTTALEFGTNDRNQSNQIPTSRMLLKNVCVFGFDTAFKFNTVNTYIFHFSDLHIEANNHIAVFGEPGTTCQNSGENVVIANSVLAGSRKSAFVYYSDNFDTLIHGCSLDFNISPMVVTYMGYKSIRISDSYIERLYEVDGKPALLEHNPRPDNHLQDVVRFTLENTVMLDNTNRRLVKTNAVGNAQSNALVSFENFDFRIRDRFSAYGDDQIFIVDDNSDVLSSNVVYPMYAKGMVSKTLNRLNELVDLNEGDLASESEYYTVTSGDGATDPRITIIDGNRYLMWDQDNSRGYVRVLSKEIQAKPGDRILLSLGLGINSFASGNIRADVTFYTKTGDNLGTITNYMDGLSTAGSYSNTKIIRPRNCAQFIAPKGIEYFAVSYQLAGLPIGSGIKMGDFQCNIISN